MQVFNDNTFKEILGLNYPKEKAIDRFDSEDSKAIQEALSESLPEVLDVLCTKAESGDLAAIREYNRLLLPKDGVQAYINFAMPEDLDSITIDDVGKILKAILAAVGKGELSIQQASELSGIVESLTHSLEIKELGMRLQDLEALIMQRLPVNKVNRKLRLIPLQQGRDGTYGQ